jgi:hypothetical protein
MGNSSPLRRARRELLGYLVEKLEVGNSEDGPLSLELNIHFIDPEKPAELLHSEVAGIDGGE